jgi:hypothetical protein
MPIELEPEKIYHGVYPGIDTGGEDEITPQSLEDYERAAGRRAAWVYFSHEWSHGRSFPQTTADWIRASGRVPFIRLMLRSDADNPLPDPEYNLKAINNGRFDDYLRAWGRDARSFGAQLIVEWGTEMNGDWFSWNAKWNGESKGAARFRDAYKRIVRIIRDDAGASNVTWVFHVNDEDEPQRSWNRMEDYYPGHGFVDWVGLSVYGAQEPKAGEPCAPFAPRMTRMTERLKSLAPGKPIFLFEFGATVGHHDAGSDEQCRPDKWAEYALRELVINNSWPEVRGFSWWNESWPNSGQVPQTEMRVQKIPELQEVFRRILVGNSRVVDHFNVQG